jgi:putative two-component system response regulator
VSGRILVVDDEPANVALLQAILEHTGAEIRGLTDSRQVEDVFLEFEPDIVLLDLHMPEPDGLEVLRRLRSARQSLGFLPVIMLTGDTGKVARNSALILGADDFLTKPLDRDEVVLRVRNLLHTRQLYAELDQANAALEQRHDQGPDQPA